MKKNLRHPIDRTGLNLCKSVKSVGLHTMQFRFHDRTGLNLCKSVKSVGLHIMQFRFHDRTGRFPFKFRA